MMMGWGYGEFRWRKEIDEISQKNMEKVSLEGERFTVGYGCRGVAAAWCLSSLHYSVFL